jgi:hypothetical protein
MQQAKCLFVHIPVTPNLRASTFQDLKLPENIASVQGMVHSYGQKSTL